MALPKQDEIEVPLLEELERMGGEVPPSELYPKVTKHFPHITQADLNLTTRQGGSLWENRIQFARQKLVENKQVDSSTRGIWRITDSGRSRLREEKSARASLPSRQHFERPNKLANQDKEKPGRLTHDELVQRVKEMGEILGKVAEGPWGPVYKHDCVWKDNPYANPKLVWEVCDKGNLDKDIASLIWAVKNWNASGILILFEESDFYTAQKKLAQESRIYPLKADDILKLHALSQAGNIQALRFIFTI